jgi:PAS domain-containing protein
VSAGSTPRGLLDGLPEAAFAISLDKRIEGMNAAAEALAGLGEGAARGRPCREVVGCEVWAIAVRSRPSWNAARRW